VVDDDPGSLAYLADALQLLGCKVVRAADGGEALRILLADSPDLVFSDLMMPGMDGAEFIQLARAYAPAVPLVLVTACDRSQVGAEALQSGAADLLQKPVPLVELEKVLARLLPGACDAVTIVSPHEVPVEGRREAGGGNYAAIASHATWNRAETGGGLDPTLLHKTTQLSLLTRFSSVLRGLSAPGVPGIAHPEGRAHPPDIGVVVGRSLEIMLRAFAGDRATLALTEAGGIQVVGSRGEGEPAFSLEEVLAMLRGESLAHSWHGLLKGSPALAVALMIQGGMIGVICVSRGPGDAPFTWADQELLEAFSAETAVTLENGCLARQLEQAFQETVTSLIITLEARDKYTEGHSLRVTGHAVNIATVLKLAPVAREQIGTAGLLHDLGKVGVPDAILRKTGRLSSGEWMTMRQHPSLGAKILEPLAFLGAETKGVRHHHERYDGRGYPDGLAAEAIPLSARVIAVADAFDAMTSARPYRPPSASHTALAHLERGAGTQFDPAVLEAFYASLPT
jgi:response regulator RpfG family c-di-GMP phosphodiesterase